MSQLIPEHIESNVTVTPEQIPDKSMIILIRKGDNLYLLGAEFGNNIYATINNLRKKSAEAETIIKQYDLTRRLS